MNKQELEREIERLRKENEQLKEENTELKKILTIFINPHIPSSKQIFKKRIVPTSKKLGAPRGHEGATRKTPDLTATVKHFLTKCPKCNTLLKKLHYTQERIVEEITEINPGPSFKIVVSSLRNTTCQPKEILVRIFLLKPH